MVGELVHGADHHFCSVNQLLRSAAALCTVPSCLRRITRLTLATQDLLIFGVTLIACGVAGISCMWEKEWPTVLLSLQATAPFLQFGAVGALTLLSPFILRGFHTAMEKWSKFLMAVVFVAMSAAIFVCPLFISSPCLIKRTELPEKPKLIGHRGAPM
ncbi:glycerophosphoinositol inositolphosphodiesterase GDPD2-like, partial [Micropterus salmoides]|uniref:glycerophosphoinositol inositolphosphodiesterase GDPD2-like n=1 Tax=Micropterus salmoides TaxID=27706 RepID=UPI0018EBEEA3